MMNRLSFTLGDVLSLCGVSHGNTTQKEKCPFCGSKSMYYDNKKGVYHCFKCDVSGGTLDFYKRYMNKADNKEAYAEIMKALYGEDVNSKERKEKIEKRRAEIESMEVKENPIRSVEERDATYKALLKLIPLAQDHLLNLRERGLTDVSIQNNGYRTLPHDCLDEMCVKLLEKGVYLDGVPGFYKDKSRWLVRNYKRGIMIPIRSREGLIQGFQIRKDQNLLTEDEGKYSWLSSKGLTEGTGVPGTVHYACDFENGKVVLPGDGIFLTEGALKGDIAHQLSGKPFISVPGVNCLKYLKDELLYLKSIGLKTVYNCYDMDYKTNPNVQKALNQTYEMISEIGLTSVRLEWDDQYKGIDDYLNAKKD